MPSPQIRPFTPSDLPDLAALHNSLASARRQCSREQLGELLCDSVRGRGESVRVAISGGVVSGLAGWVEGEAGEYFASPLMARDEVSARALLEFLLARASQKKWLRVSSFPEEDAKAKVLSAFSFRPIFEFVEFETPPGRAVAPALPPGVEEVPVASLAAGEFAKLHNAAFASVDNSLPLTPDSASEVLNSPQLAPALSLAWQDNSGRLLAFSLGHKDGALDAIGVIPEEQGRGLGSTLYRRLLAIAAGLELPRVYATVSSRNQGSLRLHRKLGIPEVERRTVWERALC